MYAVGDTMFGSIPPMGAFAPGIPPFASKHGATGHKVVPARAGNWNPKGGLLLVPWTKTGRVAGSVFAEANVGKISPGGLPRNSSWILAGVSQFEYIPNPPRSTQSPFPLMSHAAATRGAYAFGEPGSAFFVGLAQPLATRCWKVEPVPRSKLPHTVDADLEYGVP